MKLPNEERAPACFGTEHKGYVFRQKKHQELCLIEMWNRVSIYWTFTEGRIIGIDDCAAVRRFLPWQFDPQSLPDLCDPRDQQMTGVNSFSKVNGIMRESNYLGIPSLLWSLGRVVSTDIKKKNNCEKSKKKSLVFNYNIIYSIAFSSSFKRHSSESNFY